MKKFDCKNFALIAAICYALCCVYYLYLCYRGVRSGIAGHLTIASSQGLVGIIVSFCSAFSLFPIVLSISMAILLFLKKRKALLVVTCLAAAINIYFLSTCLPDDLRQLVRWSSLTDWIESESSCILLTIIAYAFLAVLITQSVTKKQAVRALWFVPAICLLASSFIYYLHWLRYIDLLSLYDWCEVLSETLKIAGIFFVGLWLRSTVPAKSKKEAALIGGADKLKLYKNLLDSGIISEEEFAAKKQEILSEIPLRHC